MSSDAPETRGVRRAVYRIHAWAGLNLGLLLYVICLSGTVAVFSPELARLADPAHRVDTVAEGGYPAPSWQAMREGIAAAQPLGKPVVLTAPRGPGYPALALVALAPGDFRTFLLDPASGAVVGEKSRYDLVAFFRIFHKQFFVVPPVPWLPHGTVVVGLFAIVLALSAVTGLWSFRRWWRGFATLRTGRSLRLAVSDLHRMAGVWAFLVALVLAVTGGWYLVEKVLSQAGLLHGEAFTVAEAVPDDGPGAPTTRTPIDLDRAAALAHQAFPALDISYVALPRRPGESLVFMGEAEAWAVRASANQVRMDPYTGAIRGVARAGDLPAGERLIAMADPLHFGTFGGLATRIVWCIAGAALCAGILTGAAGMALRMRRHAAASASRPMAAIATIAPSLAILVLAVVATFAFNGALGAAGEVSAGARALGTARLGPWTVAVDRFADGDRPPGYLIRFVGEGHPVIRGGELRTEGADGLSVPVRLRVFDDRLFGHAAAPDNCGEAACLLRLAVEGPWGDASVRIETPPAPPPAAGAPAPSRPPTAATLAVIAAFVALCALPAAAWVWLQWRRFVPARLARHAAD